MNLKWTYESSMANGVATAHLTHSTQETSRAHFAGVEDQAPNKGLIWIKSLHNLNLFQLLHCNFVGTVDWLIGRLTACQHRKVNLCRLREGNCLRRLRMANEMQCIIPYVTQYQRNTVHSNTLQVHKRNKWLSNWMTCLLIITLAPSQYRADAV